MCQKRPDTVAQFSLDKIYSIKSYKFTRLFLVFIADFELCNSIVYFARLFLCLTQVLLTPISYFVQSDQRAGVEARL
jgi:hypothetical protein